MTKTKQLKDPVELPRWTATAYYHTANGLLDVAHHIEELEELQDIIERGPNWYTLDRIDIRLTNPIEPGTVDVNSVAQ